MKHHIETLEQLATEAKRCIDELRDSETISEDGGFHKRFVKR
jgi:hypothetical protein